MLKTSLKIGYLSAENPTNKRVWSGTHYSIYKSLSALGEVTILGPHEPTLRLWIAKFINQFFLKVFNKRYSYRNSVFISKGYAKYFNKKLKGQNFDYLVAPAASTEIAFLETNIPIIYISDGTFASCLNYHDSFKNLRQQSIIEGNLIEKRAIEKSKYVVVSSQWAQKSVITDYKANENQVKIIPFGANFDLLPAKTEIDLIAPTEWKILFVGVYWENKGGEIAFNAFKQLFDKGYAVTLTVLGCIPPNEFKHPKMKVIPFIDKNDAKGQKELNAIYKQHHFLILPTRFDCTPIVINEASAFGMPSIIANTGGVAGHLKENKNGYLVAYNDNGKDYAAKIENLINHPQEYLNLRQETRKLYDELLNWNKWILEITRLLNS